MKTVVRGVALCVAGFILGGCAGLSLPGNPAPGPTLSWPHSFAPSHAAVHRTLPAPGEGERG